MIDYGKLSQASQAHLKLMLGAGLKIYGLNAEVFKAQTFNNPYKTIYPEKIENTTPSFSCKVLIRQSFEGLNISNDFISLTDKVETEFTLVSDAKLEVHQILHIRFPDNRLVQIRITAALSTHALSTVAFIFRGVTF